LAHALENDRQPWNTILHAVQRAMVGLWQGG